MVIAPMPSQAGGEGTWADEASWLISTFETIGPWLFAALLVAALARAFARRRRFRAVDVLTPADQEQVHEALRAAERRTVGEIVPVVLERSDRHPGACWLAALLTLLLGSALLIGLLPWGAPLPLLLCQLGLGGLGWGMAAWLPPLRRLFVLEARATEVAEEQAVQEFFGQRLHETEARTGVLLFVSLLERRVVVLADQGIAEVVGPEKWEEARDAVLAGVRSDSLRDGLVEGIAQVAEVLAEHAPWKDGDRNEVPDRLIVRRE